MRCGRSQTSTWSYSLGEAHRDGPIQPHLDAQLAATHAGAHLGRRDLAHLTAILDRVPIADLALFNVTKAGSQVVFLRQ